MKKIISNLLVFIILILFSRFTFAQLRSGDSIIVKNKFSSDYLSKDSILYKYNIVVSTNSNQSMVSFILELGTDDTISIKGIRINNPTNVNWGGSYSIPTVKPENFSGSVITWVPLDTIQNIQDQVSKPSSSINKGESALFSIVATGLPSIKRFWVEGWYRPYYIEELDSLIALGISDSILNKPWYSSGKMSFTIGPGYLKAPIDNRIFIDTLKSYILQAYSLKWIVDKKEGDKEKHDEEKGGTLVKELIKYLDKAREQLANNKIKEAKKQLEKFVEKVEENYKDKDEERSEHNYLTSEAYALLKYNAEYLIGQLK